MASNETKHRELLEEIRQEHDELRQLLGTISHALGDRLETVARVAEMLTSLQGHVEKHFDEEEEIGFFEQVAEKAPRLADKAQQLRDEHAQLRDTLKTLIEHAADHDDTDEWWSKTESLFRDFCRDLMHHESAENSILMDAYQQDIGDKD